MKIKKGKNSAIPMPKPKPLPIYKPKPLPKGAKTLPDHLKKQLGKPMPDIDKIIKRQESGGYSKTYRK